MRIFINVAESENQVSCLCNTSQNGPGDEESVSVFVVVISWTGAHFICECQYLTINVLLRVFKGTLEVFTNTTQYKNANIANFVLAVLFKMNETN